MKTVLIALCAAGLAGAASPALAQDADFNLTYHVERTPAARLSMDTCARVVVQAARQSRLRAEVQSFPGKLAIVKGGSRGAGAFIVQCIAVGATTVSVVQGIDYSGQKGAMGRFADKAYAALKGAVK